MRFVRGETVRVVDLRNNHTIPSGMMMYSGQVGKVVDVYDSPDNLNVYYTLTIDKGQSVWCETMLEKADAEDDTEYIETILKLIAEIDGKLDAIKRALWRRKHRND